MEKLSMDALVNASIDSLLKKVIPSIQARLAEIQNTPNPTPEMVAEQLKLATECSELLELVKKWCLQETGDLPESISQDPNESFESDTELMQDISDDFTDHDHQDKSIAANDSEDTIDPITNNFDDSIDMEKLQEGDIMPSNDELSDEEAMKLLAEMDEPEEATKTQDEEELSEEEAQRLMAEMDDPPVQNNASSSELSDEEAQRMLAEMDEPAPTKEPAADKELSDEDAQRMLAEMDEPAIPDTNPGGQDLSDEEAQRMLAEMDSDSATSRELSADEEAEALLAELGGEDEQAPSAETVVMAKTLPAEPEATAKVEEIEEIDEWEANDFQTDPDMINDFITNSDEIMEKLDEVIIQLEQEPDNKEVIEEIFRGAHTLKGAAGMFGFRALERVMHRMENLFDLIRKEKLVPNSDIIDVVFDGLDMLRTLLKAVKDGKPCGVKTAQIVLALELAALGKAPKKSGASAKDDGAVEAAAGGGGGSSGGGEKKEKAAKKKEQSTIRVDLERLDVLVNLVGELVIDRTRFASIEEELRTNYPHVELGGSFSETVQLFGRHMNEIQDIIMKVRMVPIGNAFNKFTRIVRDLARSLDKQIDLFISGETAELDKTLVEQIGDPLIHLIRNSCDHGIEDPETRKASGKSPTGKIMLSAHQEGNHIVIKIEDDGKGIPPDIIRRKGIEKGLISEEEVLENRDIFNLIFEPGFSTAEQVTNISGRGVGMDVVKKNIMKLKGMIEIDSEVGRGTTTTIRLPLTLAIVQSLLVRAKQETFAIPLSSVIESIRISPSEIQKVGDSEVYKLRDKVLPLVHLEDALDLASKEGSYADYLAKQKQSRRTRSKGDRLFVVVVGHADRPTGIVVDQLLNQQEMVIKSMGSLMRNIPCVAGGAVLGHGEVVLVLDIPELEEAAKGRRQVA